ncbi:MAG TPA: AAA family ATPase, partial [Treponemataceae bacterium]|nr:AAA family ATPase [Treponemataceae bacterium]
MMDGLESLTPKAIVAELDKYIIGQNKAKRAVAIALRNRTRRLKLPQEVRDEVAPKNILMIGPTGVGKTEIARRLAKLCGAPFLKVEATKYTEVGYVGRDVESMIRDLMATGFSMVKSEMQSTLRGEAEKRAEEVLLDLLLPGIKKKTEAYKTTHEHGLIIEDGSVEKSPVPPVVPAASTESVDTREKFRLMLREGKLDERVVEITVQRGGMPNLEVFAGSANLEDLEMSVANITNMITGNRNKRKQVTVKDAREIIIAEQLDKIVDQDK